MRERPLTSRRDPDECVTELRDDFDLLSRILARPEDDAVPVGLGSRQPGLGDGLFDASAGAAPLEDEDAA